MRLRTFAYAGLAIGLVLAAAGLALSAWTLDPLFAQLVLTGVPLAFGASVGLALAWLLPRGAHAWPQRWGIVALGAALILAPAIAFFFLYKDPMIMVFALQFLIVYGVVAAVMMWRRADSRVEVPPPA